MDDGGGCLSLSLSLRTCFVRGLDFRHNHSLEVSVSIDNINQAIVGDDGKIVYFLQKKGRTRGACLEIQTTPRDSVLRSLGVPRTRSDSRISSGGEHAEIIVELPRDTRKNQPCPGTGRPESRLCTLVASVDLMTSFKRTNGA